MSEKKLLTVVVDDDKLQLEIISDFVKKTNFLELEGAFHEPLIALEHIVNTSPDLLFLDVEMPELSGLELIRSLKNPPQTIMVTGNKDYAAEAFELDVLDYLVKPVNDYSRFLKAATKASENFKPHRPDTIGESIYVKEDALLVSVKVKDIMYFEAFGDYVKIGTTDKVYVVHSTLTKIENRLSEEFLRVHRSFVVRLDQIKNIDQFNLMVGEKIIPVSQSMRPKLMSRIKTF
ncbi:MAG: LytTR family DNA-binding domain-containing protein [Reichenbachiella sp.]|uniref:LytR/AlgR family response regulator transcription factor n=1 Tax=Reichenbachiella sp. TaxID=2184521 RepID=UPI0032679AB2